MSLRIIRVPLFDLDADDTALAAAFTIAERFDAHVLGIFMRTDLRSAAPLSGGHVLSHAPLPVLMAH